MQFWTPQVAAATGVGAERQHYTVKLTNARICDIKFSMLNNKNPELARFAEFEEKAFTYQKITRTWNDGGIKAQDDWESPVV